ncbi:MAG: hypothetical protein LDL29_01995 [Dechloromonas sp.]|nr:hypothetical protein [Dechloromonas sp.]
MSQIDSPGALPLAVRDAERRGRRYEQAVERAEAMRRAEIKAAQDRLIVLTGALLVRLSRRLTGCLRDCRGSLARPSA